AIAQDAPEQAIEQPTDPEMVIDSRLNTIIVTARRRPEIAQNIPVSVSFLPEETLQTGRIDSLEYLGNVAPHTIYSNNAGPFYTIRGVGSQGIGGLDQQLGVGVFVDDVFMSRTWAAPSFLTDLDGAEVVRGSQSLLYGKNTIGGAVNLRSRNPGNDNGGQLEVSGGSFGLWRVKLGQDIALSDDIKLRGFFTTTQSDGYIDNIVTGAEDANIDSVAGRVTALADVSENTTLRVSLDYEQIRDDGRIPYTVTDLALNFESNLNTVPFRDLNRGGLTVTVDHAFASADFKSISAYRGFDFDLFLDGDFSPQPQLIQGQQEEQSQFSQEFQLSSKQAGTPEAGDLNWRAGFYYLHEAFEGRQIFDVVGTSFDTASRNALETDTDTVSAFGELSYQVTDKLELVGGARFTYEREEGDIEIASPSGNFFFGPGLMTDGDTDYSNVSPEIGLTYRVHPDILTYARISRGFKAGGISQFVNPDQSANIYDPELAWSYEAGFKATLLDNRLTLNGAAFHIDWQDQQAIIFVNAFQRIISNAASAKNSGFELDAMYQPTGDLVLYANVGYQNGEYETFVDSIVNADFSGNDLPYTPKWTGAAGARWEKSIGADRSVFANFDYSLRGSHSFDPLGAFRQKSNQLLSAEAGVQIGNVRGSIWGKNLLDEEYLREYFGFSGQDFGVASEPLTAGASIALSW
ncbi:MAG: TonB-dependent receptor, partial [Pseudomonadota bacterium]